MKYAPIVIPTLNRYEHLERLVKSLQKNPWAEYSDIYISVDFPPNKKYEEGYRYICDYVSKEILGFKHVFIYKQIKNLGPYKNAKFLLEKVFEKYERFIFLEDDNEVSTNFIEYMDICLDKYENMDSIVGVCANNEVVIKEERKENFNITSEKKVFGLRYMTYGFATWKKEWNKIEDKCQKGYFTKMAYNPMKSMKLYKNDKHLYFRFVTDVLYKKDIAYCEGEIYPIDIIWDIVMLMENENMIIPIIPKIRNFGFDGSGIGGDKQHITWVASEQYIDESDHFSLYNEKVEVNKLKAHEIDLNSRPCRKYISIAIIFHIMYVIAKNKSVGLIKTIKNI